MYLTNSGALLHSARCHGVIAVMVPPGLSLGAKYEQVLWCIRVLQHDVSKSLAFTSSNLSHDREQWHHRLCVEMFLKSKDKTQSDEKSLFIGICL